MTIFYILPTYKNGRIQRRIMATIDEANAADALRVALTVHPAWHGRATALTREEANEHLAPSRQIPAPE